MVDIVPATRWLGDEGGVVRRGNAIGLEHSLSIKVAMVEDTTISVVVGLLDEFDEVFTKETFIFEGEYISFHPGERDLWRDHR